MESFEVSVAQWILWLCKEIQPIQQKHKENGEGVFVRGNWNPLSSTGIEVVSLFSLSRRPAPCVFLSGNQQGFGCPK